MSLYNAIPQVSKYSIKGFFQQYRFLSNFHVCTIVYNGHRYESTEAAYQAAKSLDPLVRSEFTTLSPNECRKKGQLIDKREDWERVKDEVMYDVNWIKYNENLELFKALRDTGLRYLEETNWWGDEYWGVCKGVGLNKLGETLMQVRDDLIDTDTLIQIQYEISR